MHVLSPIPRYDQHLTAALPELKTDSSAMSTPPLTADGSQSPMSSSVLSTIGEGAPSQRDTDQLTPAIHITTAQTLT